MKNQEKNVTQVRLFDIIQKELPANALLVEKVCEVLKIGIDAAYRRMRGSKPLSLEEAVTLCDYFGVSFENQLAHKEKMKFAFVPSELENLNSYVAYAKELAKITDKANLLPDCEIMLSAADIPAFHYTGYHEMTMFQLFSWHKNMYDYFGTYEDFCQQYNNEDAIEYCAKINANYQQIPSTEIWTENTIDSMIKLITYHVEMEHFNDKKIPLTIAGQLFELINKLQEWIKNGEKGEKKTPYKFFVNDIDIGNTLLLLDNDHQKRCVIRLFTINGLNINDERFCQKASNWLASLIKRSTLISGIATTERPKFITSQKQKIKNLKHFIESF